MKAKMVMTTLGDLGKAKVGKRRVRRDKLLSHGVRQAKVGTVDMLGMKHHKVQLGDVPIGPQNPQSRSLRSRTTTMK